MASLSPDPEIVERFTADLDRLAPPKSKLGIAVSGGPDSLALLLLAAAARPGSIEAATVDHKLRAESAGEAAMVAAVCDKLGVSHATLTVEWGKKPETAIQERARAERYRLLADWASERELDAILTAHHSDDQVETLLMRLNRGSGVLGLAGIRPSSHFPVRTADGEGRNALLLRPLLTWRRAQLADICAASGVEPVQDPSNDDDRFERVRVRKAIAESDWLKPEGVAWSAAHLNAADAALHWATDKEWGSQVTAAKDSIAYRPSAPFEIRRRVVRRAVGMLAREGAANPLRGPELDRLVAALGTGGTATLRGVRCTGGEEWHFAPAPPRR